MNRLFVALALPEHVRSALARLKHGLPGARWVAAENYHVTLRFIGEIDNPATGDISDALARIREPAFELEIDGFGCFTNGNNIHALWAAVPASSGLLHLQRRIDNAIDATGIARETRKFRPHITLARFRKAAPGQVNSFIRDAGPFRLPAFPVTAFTLYRSFLNRDGPVYRAEAVFPLNGPPGAASLPFPDFFMEEQEDGPGTGEAPY